MRKPIASLLALLVLAAGAWGQGQNDKKKEKKKRLNVDFRRNIGWGNCYRPGEWTPMLVEITTPYKKPVECLVRLSVRQDELNTLQIERRAVLMPGRPRQIPLCVKLAYAVDECSLTLVGSEFLWSRTFELWDPSGGLPSLTVIRDHELLVGVSGKQAFGLMNLPQASACSSRRQRGAVHVEYKFQRLLPADWTGYASLDLLILYDTDWNKLTTHQRRAIARWVTNGGRLLLVLGGNVLPESHEFAKLLPFQIGAPTQVKLHRLDLLNWGCRSWQSDTVACWSLVGARAAPNWQTHTGRTDTVLWASGPVGFGRVGVCGFDPAAIGGRRGRDVANFWVSQTKPLLGERNIVLTHSRVQPEDRWGSYRYGRSNEATNAVLEHLFSVEELRPIHIGWVVLVLVTLAVLIGPVDYLVLKKLGRLPTTWVTASVCIALFSVGAYYGVEYLRGGVLQARVVSVLDGVSGSPVAWATRYAGIFAPYSDDYRFSGCDRSQWWSGMAPTQGHEANPFAYDRTLGSRNIYCAQHLDGGSVPFSVPINIWSMQCLACEHPVASVPFRAEVRRERRREWTVTVENHSEAPIRGGYARVSADRSVALGAVPPRQIRQFTGAAEPHGSVAARTVHDVGTRALTARGVWQRSEAMRSYLRAKPADEPGGAAVVCVEYDRAPVPFGIAERRCEFDHIQMARLVVFSEGSTP